MTPIKDEDVSLEAVYKSVEESLFLKKEYSTTEVVELTGITRQPLRKLQDVIKPRAEGSGLKKQYYFSQEEVELVELAKIANDLGYMYDKTGGEGEESIKDIFLKYDNNINDIAAYLNNSGQLEVCKEKILDAVNALNVLENVDSKAAFVVRKANMLFESGDFNFLYEQIDEKEDFNIDALLKVDDFCDFVKAMPDTDENELDMAEGKSRILTRFEELVKKEFEADNISNTMEYLFTLDERPDEEDFRSYVLIARIGGYNSFCKMCNWIARWKIRELSADLSKGLYKETINKQIKNASDIFGRQFLTFAFCPANGDMASGINEVCGKDAFENMRKLSCYMYLSEVRAMAAFVESLDFIIDKLDADKLHNLSFKDIRDGGKNIYEMFTPIFDTELKEGLGKYYSNIDYEFMRARIMKSGELEHLQENDGEELIDEICKLFVPFYNKIGTAMIKDCPDEREFINAYTEFINDCISLEEQEENKD